MTLKYEISLVAAGPLILVCSLLLWRRSPRVLREFFAAATSPFNLAVFRVVLFSLVLGSFSIHNVKWFASLPAELQFPPAGLSFIVAHLPINQSVAWFASVGLTISCVLCIVGLFTRTSAFVSLVLAVYVLGVPQLFGKINHYHHLIWFILIMAVSPCADVLSIDAVRKSWSRADRGVTDPPEAATVYALPLRFVWLLMGVIYFQAGFWKIWTSRGAWVWGDNPRNIMYNKWTELAGWTPLFRIDQHPLFLKISALSTVAFELSFLFLIFCGTVRWLAPAGGLAFHSATNLFMRISFWNLQGCYVAFVDWSRVGKWIGKRLFAEDMFLLYDGNCQLCRRTIASFRVFDILARVTYVNALDSAAWESAGLSAFDGAALMRDMQVVVGAKTWRGFPAWREWMKRLPLFWLAVPFMYAWPITWLGNRLYRRVAEARVCAITEKHPALVSPRKPFLATALAGCLLTYLAVLSSVGKLQSWPMSAYPNFEDLDPPEARLLTIVTEDEQGKIRELRPIENRSLTEMSPERLMALQYRLLSIGDESERLRRLEAFWQVCQSEDPSLRRLNIRRFYRDTVSTLPENRNQAPIKRELIAEVPAITRQLSTQNRRPGAPGDETK